MKAGSRPQYDRLRRRVERVREGSASGNPPNSKDFMAAFGVSRRTVARDLDFLRDEERAQLAYDGARPGFRLTDETYPMPPVTLTRREAFRFGLARKLLAHYEGTPLHLDRRSVLDKIAESLAGDISIEPDWLGEYVSVLPEDRVRIDPEVWAQLAGFVERREAIRAPYQTFTGRVSEYHLQPYHLLAYHGNWYLLAQNVAKDRTGTFALAQFRRIETPGQIFACPPDFNPETYARQAFGIVGGEEPIKVRLLFESELAVYITERQWHPTQEFRTRSDGRIEMCLQTTGAQGTGAVGLILDARREGVGSQEPPGSNHGEASGWTTGTARRRMTAQPLAAHLHLARGRSR